MRKYRSYIIILIILIAIALYFLISDKSGTLSVRSNYFAITDTSIVSSIQIIKNPDTLILTKLNNNWIVNGRYNARSKLVKQLLGMLSLVEISSPVPKDMRTKVIGDYINNPLQVNFYHENKLIKNLRIAENDSILRSSVMFSDNENDLYLVKIPGFDGRISMLFPTNPLLYRDKIIFRYQPFEILYVKIDYPDAPGKSFMLNMKNTADIEIQSLSTDAKIKITKEKAIQYVMNFTNVPCEFVQTRKPGGIADSLQKTRPFCIIEIKNIANQVNQVLAYPISVQGKSQKFDLFRMYAVIQNDSLPLTVKYADFDPIMKELNNFSNQ